MHAPGGVPQITKTVELDAVVSALVRGGENGATSAFKRGEPCKRETIFMAYLDHASLILSEAETYFPALLDLCQSLAKPFGYVTARLTLEPSAYKCPAIHTQGDSIVLQLWGEQQLCVVEPSQGPLPMSAPRPAPLLKCTLNPGDALFLPAGLECQVVGGVQTGSAQMSESQLDALSGAPGLYVVLTVRKSENNSLGQSLGKYLNDVLRESWSESTDGFLRSAVTKQTLPSDDSEGQPDAAAKRAALEVRLNSSTAELQKKLNVAALRDHFEQRMEKLRQEQLAAAQKLQSAAKPPSVRMMVMTRSFIRVSKGVSCKCVPGENQATFKRGGETLTLPIARSASYLISDLCDGVPHAVRTLRCEDAVERLCVCQVLVFKDCLEVVEEDYRSETSDAYSGGWGSM